MAFPQRFSNAEELNQRTFFKDRILAQLDYVLTRQESFLKAIERIDDYFSNLFYPKNLDDNHNNILIVQRKEFNSICAALQTKGIALPEKMTIFKFFNTVEYFEKQAEQKPKR